MSNLLSYIFTGLSDDSSEHAKNVNVFTGYAILAILVMVMVLAMLPSWPLAIGVASGCCVIAYIAHRLLSTSSHSGGA